MMDTFNKAYYMLKPFLPWRLRLGLRRWRGAVKRRACVNTWPINEKAGVTPPAWPGWPEGKQFALVLTHDVEGMKGLQRVERLINLEASLGFRSSINLVPEGEYQVPDELRCLIEKLGFEVGIHGLEHDGRLYNSKKKFLSKAERINSYLQHWKALGFRSPLMQHKLSWLHALNIDYDASTFDTDPFEPQPDAAMTIFPFWVAGTSDGGYVELPYTLPQDFTLFIVLRESNIAVWKRKLDWIAEHGGMVLLNTHPDYMCFEGRSVSHEYPVSYYEEFLSYVSQNYKDAFWHALPREVSRFYKARLPPASRNTRKKICMLAYTTYESDNRVRRYAESLVKRGDHVDVIAISGRNFQLGEEDITGVRVNKIQRRENTETDMWTYLWPILRFLLMSSFLLARRHNRIRYDLVHVHNIPDFLVFAAWYPRWTGASVILDIHDLVPELFASKFSAKENGLFVRLLKQIEKVSCTFADYVIVSNHLWQVKLISRSVGKEKCSVFVNHVDSALFYRHARTRNDKRIIILFHGTFQWHQGLDIAIQALAYLKEKFPEAELHLYGGGGGANMEDDLTQLAERLTVKDSVKFFGGVPLDHLAQIVANADVGIVPKRADSFGNEAYSTKIMEFMSQGVPVVLSRTKIDMFYFDDTFVRFFDSGNAREMADALRQVLEDHTLRKTLITNGYEYVSRHGWDMKREEYFKLVDSLAVEPFGQFLGRV